MDSGALSILSLALSSAVQLCSAVRSSNRDFPEVFFVSPCDRSRRSTCGAIMPAIHMYDVLVLVDLVDLVMGARR